MSMIEFQNVSKSFGHVPVLKNIDLKMGAPCRDGRARRAGNRRLGSMRVAKRPGNGQRATRRCRAAHAATPLA